MNYKKIFRLPLLLMNIFILLFLFTITSSVAGQSMDINFDGYVNFGHYEQDNNLSNGPEPISWYIADIEDGIALMVSVLALDVRPYHSVAGAVTWEQCSLRAWLNGEFYEEAFSDDEKKLIVLSHIKNEMNHFYLTDGGNDTEDYVFILSLEEKKLPLVEEVLITASDYAIARGADVFDDAIPGVRSHIRTPGFDNDRIAVNVYFGIIAHGEYVETPDLAVVPAIRVRLN